MNRKAAGLTMPINAEKSMPIDAPKTMPKVKVEAPVSGLQSQFQTMSELY